MATVSVEQALKIAFDYHQSGQLATAEPIYRQIVAAQPYHADALHFLGLIAVATGRCEEAVALISRAIAQAPGQAVFHSNLGETYRRLGRLDEAIACLQRAMALEANSAEAHLSLGTCLSDLGRFDEAIASCRRALELRPGFREAHNNLGNALAGKGLHEESIACFHRALEIDPNYAEAYCNLGSSLLESGRLDEAIAACEEAVRLRPKLGDAHGNMGASYLRKGMFERSLECYRIAIACDAKFAAAHWNLALLLLLLGQYEEGWKEHEWRWVSPALASPRRNFPQPQWDGAPVPGKTILLHAEQGFGDTIQFMRYVPQLRERAAAERVILECPPELVRLLEQTGGWNVEIVPRENWEGTALPPFDLQLPMLSLPLALGIFEPLPMTGPYLRPSAELSATWRERLKDHTGFRVGLTWAGTSTHKDDRHRSLEFERWLPILRTPGATFFSLQLGPRRGDPQRLAEAGMIDLTEYIGDFADSAALVAELDLVITVDTAAAHLAGALGRPVWTLIPFIPDWRWMAEREDTPWYPTMRLFRQPKVSDWDSVLPRIADELSALVRLRDT